MLGKIANLCWEGLTLKHVSHKKIVISYLLFVFTAFLFELFLFLLYGVSCFIFYDYGQSPNFVFYLCGAILILIKILTVSMLKTTISRYKDVFLKERFQTAKIRGS